MKKEKENENIEKEASEYIQKLLELEKTLETGYKGLITKIVEKTNFEYFGVKGSYGERNGIEITVKLRSPDGEEFTNWISIPDKIRGIEKSNIFAFKKKYGRYPEKGMEVDCRIDENGFFRIDY